MSLLPVGEWKVGTDLTVTRQSADDIFGLGFRGTTRMVLKRVVPGGAGERCGACAFVGRRLTHCNGRVNARCADITACADLELHLRFAFPEGYPLEVKRQGEWQPCVVRALDEKRYVVTGHDVGGIYEKVVPYKDADELLRPAAVVAPDRFYVTGQAVVARGTRGVVERITRQGVRIEGGGRVYPLQDLRPAPPSDHVEFQDTAGRQVRFEAAGKGLRCFVDGTCVDSQVLRIKCTPLPEGDIIFVGKKEIGLPLGNTVLASNLRLLCNAQGVKQTITEEDILLQTVYVQPDPIGRLSHDEAIARAHITHLKERSFCYLTTLQRRLRRNTHGTVASTGMCIARSTPVVTDVVEGSPAAGAGITPGDVIVSVRNAKGEWPVETRQQLLTALSPAAGVFAGTCITITVSRGADNVAITFECDVSHTFRGKLVDSLRSLQPESPGMDPELIADLISDPERYHDFCQEVLNNEHELNSDETVESHMTMMKQLCVPHLPEVNIRDAFVDACAFYNTYNLPSAVVEPLLLDTMVEAVFALEEAKRTTFAASA